MGMEDIEFRPSGSDKFAPMHIAEHEALTAREKLDLLEALKAKVSALQANSEIVDFEPQDIDEAIRSVQQRAADGETSDANFLGDH